MLPSRNSLIDISQYEKRRKIGEGCTNNVYLVKDKSTGIFYAAKIRKDKIDEKMKDSQEISISDVEKLMYSINHPSILKIFGYYQTNFDNKPFPTMIMELSANPSLKDVIMPENACFIPDDWNLEKKCILIYGIASGMAHLHAQKIINGNLKPKNIYLDEYLHPKIFNNIDMMEDFNINDLAYMAPEVISGEEYKEASDVYSYGIIVYEIMTGKKISEDFSNLYQFITYISSGCRPALDENVPELYSALIEACWDQYPANRPTFSQIIDILKDKENFDTDVKIIFDEYLDYIEYIDNYQAAIDSKSDLVNFDTFMRTKRNKEAKKVQINIKKKSEIHQNSPEESGEIECSFDISQYQIINKIGQGGFGEVYKVKNKVTNKIYAAKISFQRIGGNEDEEEDQASNNIDLIREVNNSYKFNHPAIVKFNGFSPVNFEGDHRPVMIIEYVNGGTLKKLMENVRKGLSDPKWNDTKKLMIIYGIASAMDYLHSNNIVHRDLKPDNILLDDDLNPKISDFGFSKKLHSNEESMSMSSKSGFKGTYQYSPPEIFMGKKFTKESDVYAFALIAYEIMTNFQPFENYNIFVLIKSLAEAKRPNFDSQIPNSYKELIENCWSQEPECRPTFSEIVDKLKNDGGFITESVEESVFLNYVDYIDEYPVSFKENKIIPSFKEFCKAKIDVSENKQFETEQNKQVKTEQNKQVEIEQNKNKQVKTEQNKQVEIEQNKQFETEQNKQVKTEQNKQVEIEQNKNKIVETEQNKQVEIEQNKIVETEQNKIVETEQNKNKLVEIEQSKNEQTEIDQKSNNETEKIIEHIPLCEKGIEDLLETWEKLFYGKGVAVDYEASLPYIKLAAEKGQVTAMFSYASMLNNGHGIPANPIEASLFFKKAADEGHVESMFIYASMMSKGNGLRINKKEALEYFKKAAEKGHVESMYKYAMMLLKSQKSSKDAAFYLKKAADRFYVKAMFAYANLLSQEKDNEEELVHYYKMAADNGHIESMICYANLLKEKSGNNTQQEESAKYYKMAADNGNKQAMEIYAEMLNKGIGALVDDI